MPCIRKPRESVNDCYQAYCGKYLGGGDNSFRTIKDAQSGDKPICPKCRKALNLSKKMIKTRITNSFVNRSDKVMTLHFNNKEKLILSLDFDIKKGFYLDDRTPVTDDEQSYIDYELKKTTEEYAKLTIKNMDFEESDVKLLQMLINISSDFEHQEQLLKIKEKLSFFLLK